MLVDNLSGTPVRGRDNRDYSLDILRGIAVILMIFHHVVTWLYTDSIRDIITIIGRISVGDIAAPIFFTVCGMSLYYSINVMQAKHLGTVNILKKLAQRNLRLYFIGLVLGLVAFGQSSFFYWGVLQSLAAAGFLAGALYLLPARKTVLLFTGFLSLAGYYFFHPYAYLLPAKPGRILLGDFSLVLLTGFLSIGLFMATYVLTGNYKPPTMAAAGLSFTALGLVGHFTGFLITRFPASPSYIIFAVGLTLLMYAALLFVKADGAYVYPAVWTGRNALNIFVLHYLIYVYAKYAGLLSSFNGPYSVLVASAVTAFFLLLSKWMVWPSAARHRNNKFQCGNKGQGIFL